MVSNEEKSSVASISERHNCYVIYDNEHVIKEIVDSAQRTKVFPNKLAAYQFAMLYLAADWPNFTAEQACNIGYYDLPRGYNSFGDRLNIIRVSAY